MDESLDTPLTNSPGIIEMIKRYWIYAVLGIFAVNILILDLFVFFSKSQSPQTSLSESANLSGISKNYCPQGCLEQINLALKSQGKSVSTTSSTAVTAGSVTSSLSPTPSPTSTPTPTPTPINTAKEFFVPLGTGTGNSADWTVVDGMGARVDLSNYGEIEKITFEVTVRIPTGNQIIWIRLYNANTYQSVAGSELTLSTGTATLLTSSPLTLASGDNLYQIQMKTQLQSPTNINMARLRIKTK